MKFFGTFLLSLFLDQLTKFLAGRYVPLQYNSGISFNWLPGSNQLLITACLLIFLVGVGWAWRKTWRHTPAWSGLFFGAAISNLLDRMLYSGVRDWLIVPGFQLKNNLADWLVFLSLGFILIQVIQNKKKYAD